MKAASRDEGKPDVRVFEDLEALSRAAAQEFDELARKRQSAGLSFVAALSGGSTPKRFYELLATPEFSVPWARIQLVQVDERAVPPDSLQSNYRMIREAMLDRVPLPPANFHRMEAERPDRDAAARDYEAELRGTVPAGAWPRLDLICLGMGDDGHTASLFPGTSALREESLAVCPNYVEKLKMWRMTITRPVLNAAARIIFLVSGGQKAGVLRQVLQDVNVTPPLPAQLVRPANGTVAWYVDRAAARLL